MMKTVLNNRILNYISKIDENRFKVTSVRLPVSVSNRLRKNSKKRSAYSSNRIEGNPLSQEQADEVLNVIETCTKVASYDTSIYDIVNEQAQAFFAGQKSVDEVARLIQSKANIYVNEQR